DTAAISVFLNQTYLTPVTLSGLMADEGEGWVTLRWSVYAEGVLGSVQVYRSEQPGGPFQGISGLLELAPGETLMSYRDATVQPGRDYYYKVTMGSAVAGPLHVRTAEARLELQVAGANPLRGSTVLHYGVPAPGRVRAALHDVQGRLVRVLLDEVREAGWGDISVSAQGLAAGVYFARLETLQGSRSTRITVLK
ncbi:MAG TPA: T9SS type A sorting domain-containing protein, partial [Candidatus Saccharimonadales bacterium]|nr:T9SS type A sorting domain-containing protein [Candidatus Saccharimonadales bacterium]